MALNRKEVRTIVVENVTFRWQIGTRASTKRTEDYVLLMQPDDGKRLTVTLPWYETHDGEVLRPILPGLVGKLIRAALANGWKPRGPGAIAIEIAFGELLPNESPPERTPQRR